VKRALFFVIVMLAAGSLLYAAGAAEEPEPDPVLEVAEVVYMDQGIQWATVSEYEADTGRTIRRFNEAPMLAEKVAAGELPPVEERMPLEPAVMRAPEEIGRYGGTFRRAWTGPADHWGLRHHLRESPVYLDIDGVPQPNLFKDIEVIGDGDAYVFHMREGLRWSDGELMTSADSAFWWELKLDETLYHPHRDEYLVGGEKPEITVEDEYTWRIDFPGPNPLFLDAVGLEGRADLVAPKHYLKDFHPSYVTEAELQRTLDEKGYDDWQSLMDAEYQIVTNPDRPYQFAFRPVSDPSDSEYRWERNPYYWKVDEEGNQLPYVDYFAVEYVTERELIVSLALGGEISQSRHIAVEQWAMLMEGQARGNYTVYARTDPRVGGYPIGFNLTHKDPMMREVFQEVDFRRALSHAIDREEINEIVFFGLGTPRQFAWTEHSAFYDPEWEQAYIEYDPDYANELLDGIGLEWGGDGFRTWPDGSRLRFEVQDQDALVIDMMELIKGYWANVGVDIDIDTPERGLATERKMAGDIDARRHYPDRCWNPHLRPVHWAPNPRDAGANVWGIEWNRYLATEGREGEEPPEDVARLQRLIEAARMTVDLDARAEYMAEVAEWHRENIPYIGTVGDFPVVQVVQNNLRNAHVFARDHLYVDASIDEVFLPIIWWDD